MGRFNNLLLLCKRTVPIQALIPTAVHSRGMPAQPAYPAVHLESTTRATCEYPTTGTGGPARTQLSSKIKYKRNPPPVPRKSLPQTRMHPSPYFGQHSCQSRNPTKEKSSRYPPPRRKHAPHIISHPRPCVQPHVAQAPSATPPGPGKVG